MGRTRARVGRASVLLALGMLGTAACEGLGGLAAEEPPPTPKRDAGPRDTGASDGLAPDGGDPTPITARCDALKPFDPPELQTDIEPTAAVVRSAVVSADELELHFLKFTSAGSKWELRRSLRPSRDAEWGAASTVNVGPAIAGLSISAGGLKAYWWTLDSNFVASRPTIDAPFADAKTFWLAKKPQVFVVASDDAAYLAEYIGDGGVIDKVIMRAAMNGSANGLLAPVAVPNIHKAGALDSQPVLDTNETALYFSSNRPGGKGLADVWVARRATKLDAFGKPVHVPELSTETVDGVSWVSDDDCEILVERASHIYRARRPL